MQHQNEFQGPAPVEHAILRKILAFLIVAILLIGSSPIVLAGTSGPDACAATGGATSDGCCGGGVDTSLCQIACLVSPAALNTGVSDWLAPMAGAALLDFSAPHERSLAWPPDTAPPKPFSA